KLRRNWAFELNRQIRDAAPRIELKGRHDRAGRTRFKTPCAGTAVIRFGTVRLELCGGNYLRQKEPITEAAADQVCVLSDESNPGPLRQVALKQRTSVHIPKRVS